MAAKTKTSDETDTQQETATPAPALYRALQAIRRDGVRTPAGGTIRLDAETHAALHAAGAVPAEPIPAEAGEM